MIIPAKVYDLALYLPFISSIFCIAGTILFGFMYKAIFKTEYQAEAGLFLIVPTIITLGCWAASLICIGIYGVLVILKWWFSM